MLQTNTINKFTLELLNRICDDSEFDEFILVGGTALALHLGHRISVDLDFFNQKEFNESFLSSHLIKNYNATISNISNNTLTGDINGVKFDFISHQYPELNRTKAVGSIRLATLEDISAMKFNAIRNRGTKKDFIDIYFLLQHFTLKEMLEFTNKKYPNHIDILTLKSLVYFDDADLLPDCNMLVKTSWEKVKEEVKKEVLPFL